MELIDFSDLPIWRKVAIITAFGLFFYLGGTIFSKELGLYSGPPQPNSEEGKIIPVHVVHGSLRYATPKQVQDWNFWSKTVGPNVGVPFLVALGVWFTSKKKRKQ